MQIKAALAHAISQLPHSESAALDAQILLAHVMQVDRAYLFAWPEQLLSIQILEKFAVLIAERQRQVPIAYLTGHQSFWTLDLDVNVYTLIPRPETELLVAEVLALPLGKDDIKCADLGTGSGAIALALASERPAWQIYATDYSEKALACASKNAQRLRLEQITFLSGFWCTALPSMLFDVIVSNPPYISATEWQQVAQDLHHEPKAALCADDDGYADLSIIAADARRYLKDGGYICFEHGFQQAKRLRMLLQELGYVEIKSVSDLAGLDRVTLARHQQL